jgi:predicted amino acid dehydrogenase
MKHIMSLSYSGYGENFDTVITYQGVEVRVTQFNIDFDFDVALGIIKEYDGKVDAFALSGVPPTIIQKGVSFIHPQIYNLRKAAVETPLLDGSILKRTYYPYALRQFALKNSKVFTQKRVSIYAGAFHYSILDEIEALGGKLCLGDPYFFLKIPKVLHRKKSLDYFIKYFSTLFKGMKIKRSNLSSFSRSPHSRLKEFFDGDIFIGNESTFNLIELDHLRGKTVFIDFINKDLLQKLEEVGVKEVIVATENSVPLDKMNFSLLEAILQVGSDVQGTLSDDDILDWMLANRLEAKRVDIDPVSNPNQKDKFAFVIHPLGRAHLFKHPLLKFIAPYSKPLWPFAEEILSRFPSFFYGKMKGIVSEKTGQEVEGLIYMVPDTPKMLLEKDVDTIYARLGGICDKAADSGAQIIGLGAYTKIVGDAGVTVDAQSPIPVTTGNSLSACATLWAAKFALERMNLVEKENGRYKGICMVVGATGSIGAVSAKILAQNWSEIVLVAPRAYKVMELKEEIHSIDSSVQIHVSTKASTHIRNCDLIITTTSAQGRKILEIEQVKPGAIICDVSRPFDISEEDALKRPDVMVIASGEVRLPGPLKMKMDIGLEGNIVYACLAETALLAMAGKFESFTLSRVIDYKKVLEIDRLASEHGVRMSCIMGHSGFITDEEFSLCREHALIKLNEKTKK